MKIYTEERTLGAGREDLILQEGTELFLNYADHKMSVSINNGSWISIRPGQRIRLVDRFNYIKVRSDSNYSMTYKITISDGVMDDKGAYNVPVGVLMDTFEATTTFSDSQLVTPDEYVSEIEIRAHYLNAHAIQIAHSDNPGGADHVIHLTPLTPPLILRTNQAIYAGKGPALGYGTNTEPQVEVIKHF